MTKRPFAWPDGSASCLSRPGRGTQHHPSQSRSARADDGRRPQGWLSPGQAFTEHTRDFLAAEKLLWHGDARDCDLPHVVDTKAGAIVHIPASDFTDNRTLRGDPTTLWNVYKETFDYLYLREPPALLALSMHCHFGGRPLISAIVEKILKYMAQYPDVWFASYGEIARWVLATQRGAATQPRRLFGQAVACS